MSDRTNTIIRVRPVTREKIEAIIAARRDWTMTQAVDTALDKFIETERVPFPRKGVAMGRGRGERRKASAAS